MKNMRIINDLITVNLKNEKKETLFINALNGLIDVVNEKDFAIISDWKNSQEIIVRNEHEQELMDALIKRQYALSAEEEDSLRSQLTAKLLEKHKETVKSCKSVTFVLTYACNFACPYCYEKANEKSDDRFMTTEMADAVINLYPNGIDHVGFFGGEPLLPKNKPIIKYIMSKLPNAVYSVITNGFYLKDYLDEFKSVNTKMVQVTLDGAKELHNQTRKLKNGKPTFDEILSGIELYLTNGLPIKIRMNITKENYSDCNNLRNDLLIKFNQYNDLLSFEMQPIFQYNSLERGEFLERMLIDDDYINKDNETKNKLNSILSTFPQITNFFFAGGKISPVVSFCDSENHNRFYDAEGNIYSCILAVRQKHKSVGTYYPEVRYKDNSMLNRTIDRIERCSKCRYALICGGGCPNAVINADGNAFVPNCLNIDDQLKTTIPLMYKLRYNTPGKTK